MQIGDGNVQVNVFRAALPLARTAYLHQVQAIAPEVLTDRDAELSELVEFCTRPDAGDWMWWRAAPWAGKTALLSWFVLRPPPGTRIVSFFVTGRFAAQNDREAFLDVVIEQLATLLGEPIPLYWTAATRTAHLWAMLDAAARHCRRQGQRLLLVVDGIDEDRGADTHSIAALLPAHPAEGMRIVVAGRLNPPLPSDVPPEHPLRDPSIIRTLEASPHARNIQQAAPLELGRLLRGSDPGQELVGLVTAAGGGLSGQDLAELTGRQMWEVEDTLRTAAGRTFTRRPTMGRSDPVSAGEVYLLAHEELHEAATRFLGGARLRAFHERIHCWADRWRRAGWPAETPEYLLIGYFRMLHAHAEPARMIACALDVERHRALLDVTGGDAAALAEITATQDVLLDREPPDLRGMTLLAVQRDALTDRNREIPTRLPAVWARLGHPLRAEALARSISDPSRRARAFAALSEALAEGRAGGQAGIGADEGVFGAGEVADEAEAAARSVTEPEARAEALARVAEAWAESGHARRSQDLTREAEHLAWAGFGTAYKLTLAVEAVARAWACLGDGDRVETLARELESLSKKRNWKGTGDELPDWAATTARALARAGDVDRAETVARGITNVQAMAFARVVEYFEQRGDNDRAEILARHAAEQERTVDSPELRSLALAEVAAAAAQAGDAERAERLLCEAEHFATARTADSHTSREQARSLLAVVVGWAGLGHTSHAEELARQAGRLIQASMQWRRVSALAWEADIWARLEHSDRAENLARQAETIARTAGLPGLPRLKLTEVAVTWAWVNDANRAEALARTVAHADARASALAEVTAAIAARGHAGRAHTVALSITSPALRARALATAAAGMTRSGDATRAQTALYEAEAAARATPTVGARSVALAEVAAANMSMGQVTQARSVLRKAESLAQWIAIRDSSQGEQVQAVAEVMAGLGHLNRAVQLAQNIMDLGLRTQALLKLAADQTLAGESEQARVLIQEAEDVIRTNPEYGEWKPLMTGLAEVAEAWARFGAIDRASELARKAADLARTKTGPCLARADAAAALARQGDLDGIETVIRTIASPWCRGRALAQAAEALAQSGHIDQAEILARTIALPHWQAVALVEVARRTDTARAHHLLIQALRVDAWQTAADLLTLEIPDVLVKMVDELLASQPDLGESKEQHGELTWLPRFARQWSLTRRIYQRDPEPT
ncbi:hypothetical protein ACWEKM_18785 [Streptomyces sp. NPDC004752]